MNPLTTLLRGSKLSLFLSAFMFFQLFFITEVKADTHYLSEHISIDSIKTGTYQSILGSTCLTFKILAMDHDGDDDELDDIYLSYLNPETKEWVRFFHADCDNGDTWQVFDDTDDSVSEFINGKIAEGDLDFGYMNFYPPENLFLNSIIFKAELDWDIDENESNTGLDHTFYYLYKDTSVLFPSKSWPDFASFDYDTADVFKYEDNDKIKFTFLMTEMFGDGVLDSYGVEVLDSLRNELDDVVLQYKDGEDWKDIIHGDCDNAWDDFDFQIFPDIPTDAKVTTKTVGYRHYADIEWDIPESILGRNITFRYQYKWDEWKTSVNGASTLSHEFTVQTYTDKCDIDEGEAIEKLCDPFPSIQYEWKMTNDDYKINNAESVEKFIVYRFNATTEKSFAIATLFPEDDFEPSNTVFSLINSVDGTRDRTDNNEYLLEDGVSYSYWVDIYYKGVEDAYSNKENMSTTSTISLKPTITLYAEILGDAIKIGWKNACRVGKIELKRTGGGVSKEPNVSLGDTFYIDTDVSGCVLYNYTLLLSSHEFNGVPYENSYEVSKLINASLADALTGLEISKGYYDDRVLLEWNNNGSNVLEYIRVERKQLKAKEYSTLKVLDPEERTYLDESALSGVYYKYKVSVGGKCGDSDSLKEVSLSDGIGFAQRTGVITGQIMYEGGTAVEGVRVALESNSNSYSGSAVESGDGMCIQSESNIAEKFSDGFTIEGWFKLTNADDYDCLFESHDDWPDISQGFGFYQFGADDSDYLLKISGQSYPFSVPESAFESIGSTRTGYNHWAVTYANDVVKVYCNAINVLTKPVNEYVNTSAALTVGTNYNGYIDEIRLWSKEKTQSQIEDDFTRLLSGTETGLKLYWRLDENYGDYVYDMSNQLGVYNKNHGGRYGAAWCTHTPPIEYLALCGLTDEDGYYIIDGIRYQGVGETFKATPQYGVHEFSPKTRTMFIGNSSLTQNDKNFEDVSSFSVKGVIFYEGTNYPVKDVYIKVDGNYVKGSNGLPEMTDTDGSYDVDVPIGEHYIQIEKNGHEFLSDFFPPKDSLGEIQVYAFENPLDILNFYDVTKVKVIGKVVGGSVEASKKSGSISDASENNIGVFDITFSSTNDYQLVNGSRYITIRTREEDGNYEIELIPEAVTPSVKANKFYSFLKEDITTIDLSDSFDDLYVIDSIFSYKDSIFSNKDSTVKTVKTFDSLSVACVYNYERNWVVRSKPKLEVTGLNGSELFGDSIIYNEDIEGNKTQISIAQVLDNGEVKYELKYPVFRSKQDYSLTISAYEDYTKILNGDTIISQVPIQDGVVLINNNCAINTSETEFSFDKDGKINYTFWAGIPNLAYPNTKSIDIKLKVGNEYYSSNQLLNDFYVFGSISTGNNFVTKGPDEIDFILRDPPGSNSYAYFEEGFTSFSENTYTTSASGSVGFSVYGGIDFAPTFYGMEIEIKDIVTASIECNTEANSAKTSSRSVTFNQSYSTSESDEYVGGMGDVFFGKSTNIVYGAANSLELILPDKLENKNTIIDSITYHDTLYYLAQGKVIKLSPEFNTTFVYTQNHIEEVLIPNLIALRNQFYRDHIYDESVGYHLVGVDVGSKKYLSNNDDRSVWLSKVDSIESRFDGFSYKFYPPLDDGGRENWGADTVRFYNQQINLWETYLLQNEKDKLKSKAYEDLPSNISFDAGAVYESSVTVESESSWETSFMFEVNETLGEDISLKIVAVMAGAHRSATVGASLSYNDNDGTIEEQTVGFVLADEDAGDYYSVDVLKSKLGYGPIFRTRGGQSSCPYQGAEVTKYYTPGAILSEATMQIEQPHITVDENLITGVSEDDKAFFTVELSNTSESGNDGWYNLIVDPISNPYGATVALDGAPMGANGKQILIPAGQTVYKTISVAKGRTDIDEYEDIRLIVHSQCQYDPTDFVDDIFDEVTISAHFVPACSPISILQPLANWVVNKDNEDELNITLGGYNLKHDKMQAIALQYKAKSASTWITEKWWVNNPALVNKDDIEDTLYIDDAISVNYTWDMSPLSDREYEIRAISFCDNNVNSYSEVMAGMLDGKAPKLFGTPEPADGILSTGEDIAINFDEEIEAGMISSSNVTVKGILNGYETNHDVSVQFDGSSSTIESGDGLQLANRSFTMEFWLKVSDFMTNGNIISYGYTGTNGLSLEMVDGEMLLSMNGISRSFPCETNTTWHHYAISYDLSNEILKLLEDDGDATKGNVLVIDNVNALTDNTTLIMGDNAHSTSFAGNIHDVRVWSKSRNAPAVYADMYSILNGKELGLMSYWRMDEAFGDLIQDKASARHAVMSGASWLVNPAGKSYDFNGSNALLVDISAIPVTGDGDMTIEFWMKAGNEANGSTLFSNGNPETVHAVDLADVLAFGINEQGVLEVNSNTQLLASNNEITDDEWHHIALVVKRTGNAVLYVDGNLETSVYGSSFGSFGASKLAIGALKDNITDTTSHYFTGQMDEIRIWHSARPQDIIALYRNARVSSKDLGLRAYFPFEKYEKNSNDFYESIPTVEDQSYNVDDGASYCGTCANVGDESFSDLTPNIKRDRELSEVNCDITVNVDKIVITPTDPDSKLENCMLEISVDGIYDKYENKMTSAVTWTAYVDRNTVTWTEDEIEMTKDVNGEVTFSTFIRNSGGTYESFSVENLPSWLEASPSAGIIAPDDDEKIEFTVQSGLNIGLFNEDLYLKTDFGFDEKMNIDLRVNGEAPEWKVNTGENSESMSFVGRVKIENQASSDEGDIVAVFAGEDCRGVTSVEYFAQLDEYLLMLTVYGELSGEDLTYRVYDASTGQVFTSCSVDSAFVAQMVYGSVANPVIFAWDDMIKNNIPLQNGWNWISFNSTLDNYSDLNGVMSNVKASNGDRIKSVAQGKVSQYYEVEGQGLWMGTVTKPENDEMYQCYIQNGGNLVYEGVSISPKDFSIEIESGWNRISYIPSINLEVNEALSAYNANAEDVIKSQLGFAIYTGFSWIGSLEYLEPGKGYMLKRVASEGDDESFTYPVFSSFVSTKSGVLNNTYDVFGLNPYDFATSSSILAEVKGIANTEGAYLLAYIGDKLRGVTALNDELMFVTVYGNEGESADITFEVQTLAGNLESAATCQFNSLEVVGSLDNPFQIETVPTSVSDKFALSNAIQVYPNPMSDMVNVSIQLARTELVSIEVYNTLGQRVFATPMAECQAGKNDLQWNASTLPDGVYTVMVTVGDKQQSIVLSKVSQ